MSLKISQDTIDVRTGQVYEQFLFFARPITIHKEPIQNIVAAPQNPLFGYGLAPQTTESQVTYTPVSQTFSGLIIYPFKNKNGQINEFDNKIFLNPDSAYIKVAQDCRDFIKSGGKVEKIEADGETWNLANGYKSQQQTYLGLKFYYFEIKGTS